MIKQVYFTTKSRERALFEKDFKVNLLYKFNKKTVNTKVIFTTMHHFVWNFLSNHAIKEEGVILFKSHLILINPMFY